MVPPIGHSLAHQGLAWSQPSPGTPVYRAMQGAVETAVGNYTATM